MVDNMTRTSGAVCDQVTVVGGTSCGVLVTGLAGLLVAPDGHNIALSLSRTQDALAILSAVAGDERVRSEHDAAPRLVALCGNSPLASPPLMAYVRRGSGIALRRRVRWSQDGDGTPERIAGTG
jgi:hypothetical protein